MAAPRDLLLAVDGGGTKTRAVVADLGGRVLGRGLGASANFHDVGFPAFERAVRDAVTQAMRGVEGGEGAWPPGRVAAACFGLAGVDSADDAVVVTRWIEGQALAPEFLVLNDAELILASGTPEGHGVALVSGTGSICLGRAPDGRTMRAGGWGGVLGDEGSGHDVGVRALRAAAQTLDGRAEAPRILEAVLRQWSVSDGPGLAARAQVASRETIAGLAAAVLQLAQSGDGPAQAIVATAARDLAHHVKTVVRRLGLPRPPLALGGGFLRSAVRDAVLAEVGDAVGRVEYIAEPALGAIHLARRLVRSAPPRART
jgi:N-acetylglucosamine kinase-like BadF-type ATPase